MIVAGGGALRADAGEAILALAEILRSPVATTISGKGVVPETHPLAAGVAGSFGIPMVNTLLIESDCVVFIGSKAGQSPTLSWSVPRAAASVIHVDVDPEELGRNFRDTIGIVADARVGTQALALALRGRAVNSAWDHERIGEMRRGWWEGRIEYKAPPQPGVLKPQDVMRAMTALMTGNDVLVTDASLASGWGATRWQAQAMGRCFFAPRGLAGLGWGLPAAIGVATARRDQQRPGRVVCLAGDGGWAYSMAEVEPAARLALPIVSVILNNSRLAWIDHVAAGRFAGQTVSGQFLDVRFADAGRALGARSARVDALDEFKAAFQDTMQDPTAWVIEVRSCDVETPVLQPPLGTLRGGY